MGHPGRPRQSGIDARIVDAFTELVVERGYARVTVEEIVSRAATNKPAFYRRFRSIAEIVPLLLASRHGTDEDIDTGGFLSDLVEVQQRQQRLFTDPVIVRGFAGWLGEISADIAQGSPFVDGYLAPRRRFTQVLLDRAAERGEIGPGADPDWVADVLTGPLLMRALLPGMPPIDDVLIAHTIHAVLDAVEYTGDRSPLRALPGE